MFLIQPTGLSRLYSVYPNSKGQQNLLLGKTEGNIIDFFSAKISPLHNNDKGR